MKIFGTDAENVDAAEDREKFDAILEKLKIPRPAGKTVFTTEQALEAAERSRIFCSGQAVYVLRRQRNGNSLQRCGCPGVYGDHQPEEQEHPFWSINYLIGKELEVDAICDGKDILIRASWNIWNVPAFIPATAFPSILL